MSIDVTVLRVFTDSNGNFGNPLGVVDAGLVQPDARQRLATQLGHSETIFIDLPADGATTANATIHLSVGLDRSGGRSGAGPNVRR